MNVNNITIDIVYTWVDLNNIEWLKKGMNSQKKDDNDISRYCSDLNEILYSIKSIKKYFRNKYRKYLLYQIVIIYLIS